MILFKNNYVFVFYHTCRFVYILFRTLFGGSVGPNRKAMPDGSNQYHYDGIQVRKVPLPLRVPPSAQSQSPQPQILKTLPNQKQQPQNNMTNNNIQPQQVSQASSSKFHR